MLEMDVGDVTTAELSLAAEEGFTVSSPTK